jgi:hypothetical protein
MAEPLPAPGSAPSRWDLSPRRKNLLVLFLLFLATVPMLTKVFTSDFGTHLALGRDIVQTLTIKHKEFLNYTSLGLPTGNHEWGFQAILYIVYSLGGLYGISLLCWAVVFCIFLLLHRSMLIRGANSFIAILAIFAFSGFLRIRIQPRPEIITYLFISLTIFLFTEYFFGTRKRLLYLYPALMLVWGNIHGSFLIGLVLGGGFFVDALFRAAWRRELQWKKLKTWVYPPIAVGLLGLVTCGLNPLGYDALLAPLHLLSRGGGQSSVLMSISELTPVKGTGLYFYYKAAALFAALSLLLGVLGRRIYLLDLLLFGIAFKGAYDSARAVSMMGLFLSPGVSLHLTGFFHWMNLRFTPKIFQKRKDLFKEKKKKKRDQAVHGGKPVSEESSPVRLLLARVVISTVLIVLIAGFGGSTLYFSFSQLEYGIGMTEHKFSFSAIEFLKKNPIRGNMFNFFDVGGFLDWQLYPQALTFIDGRAINSEVFRDHQVVTGALPGWEEVLKRHGVTYMVTKTMDSSGTILPLIPSVANDPAWSLVFADGLFVVFVRNQPEFQEYIRKFGIPKSVLPKQIIREAYHYLYLGVSPVVAYQTISNMYMLMGNRVAAADAIRKLLEEVEVPFLRDRLEKIERGDSFHKR